MTVLLSERLTLREFTPSDFDAVHEFASDPEVVRWVEWGPNTIEDTRGFFADVDSQRRAQPRTDYPLASTLTSTGEVLGSAMLRTLDPDYQEGSLGYALIRDHWGNGYATEITRRLIEFGFDTIEFERITATCDPRNIASSRVLTKAGMTQIAHLPNHRVIRGEPGDSLLFAITRDERP